MSGPDFSRLTTVLTEPVESAVLDPLDRAKPGKDMTLCLFDQSLDSTGFVAMARIDGEVYISESRTLRGGETGLKGFAHDFARAWVIEQDADRAIVGTYTWGGVRETVVVHEMPPVGNKRIPGAGKSSTAAAIAVRSAALARGHRVVMTNAQQAKQTICGNAKADKKEAHAALAPVLARIPGGEKVTNEHERDAVLLGINLLVREH